MLPGLCVHPSELVFDPERKTWVGRNESVRKCVRNFATKQRPVAFDSHSLSLSLITKKFQRKKVHICKGKRRRKWN